MSTIFEQDYRELEEQHQTVYSNGSQFLPPDPELDQTIWVLGCSFVQGEGVELEERFTNRLAHKLGYPVVNLGMKGAGPARVWQTYLALCRLAQPRTTVFCWPGLDRYHTVVNNTIEDLGAWKLDPQHVIWRNNPDIIDWYQTSTMMDSIRPLNQQLIEYAKETALDAVHFNFKESMPTKEFIDLAEDGRHPGPRSHQYIADLLEPLLRPRC